MAIDHIWFNAQVTEYAKQQPRYEKLAEHLSEQLKRALLPQCPCALIQARAKTLASFAEKILRKPPTRQVTDLCGARIILHTRPEVDLVCRFLREHFVIDEENTLDRGAKLGTSEFGYRSMHYIVVIGPDRSPAPGGNGIELPSELHALRAEIQVRTIAQHCWADVGHDRLYKSPFKVPEKFIREMARAAALLENVDESLTRVVGRLEMYLGRLGVYMPAEKVLEEIELLETVRRCDDPENRLLARIARLALGIHDWPRVIALLQGQTNDHTGELTYCLGLALCRMYKNDPAHGEFQKGQKYLEQAQTARPRDVEVLIALAESYRPTDEAKALALYSQAFALDATHPRALGEYARLKLAQERSLAFLPLIRPSLEAAARRCQEQIDAGLNIPWAYFSLGEFRLFSNQSYNGLSMFAEGVRYCPTKAILDDILELVDRLRDLRDFQPVEWLRRLLLLGMAARFPRDSAPRALAELATRSDPPQFKPPIVIVAGGCDITVQRRIDDYRKLFLDAFRDFEGTILSGGTTSGISGLVGELAAQHSSRIRALAYLPSMIPLHTTKDTRYSQFVPTPGRDFSPLEPLQNWIDLLVNGIRPAEVTLLGINGGEIAAFEYRLALALGAKVGILRDSGREAGRMARDAEESGTPGLALLPADLATLRTFIQAAPRTPYFERDIRDRLGAQIHKYHYNRKYEELGKQDPYMAPWDQLPKEAKASTLGLVKHIGEKLHAAGLHAYPVPDRSIRLYEFSPSQVETMAELEHGRWNVEHFLDGWILGHPRDVAAKHHPDLVSWAELAESSKDWNRNAIRMLPALLRDINLEIGDLPNNESGM